jgi:hypothetical protein
MKISNQRQQQASSSRPGPATFSPVFFVKSDQQKGSMNYERRRKWWVTIIKILMNIYCFEIEFNTTEKNCNLMFQPKY